jgi:hypothetical protein
MCRLVHQDPEREVDERDREDEPEMGGMLLPVDVEPGPREHQP